MTPAPCLEPALTTLRTVASSLSPVDLATVLAEADLQSRIDRKYLVPPHLFETLVEEIRDRYQILDIGGLRTFRYQSIYFDTPDLASYRGAAHGRRHKFKVRTRTYLDSGETVVEVKTEGGREQTLKERLPHPGHCADDLDGSAVAFVDARLDVPGGAASLKPMLTTTYVRTTLVDLEQGIRMTCDANLVVADSGVGRVSMTDHVLVETKSASTAGSTDRLLWRLGIRPVTISKYCVGLAALNPRLPSNRWHRILSRHFQD